MYDLRSGTPQGDRIATSTSNDARFQETGLDINGIDTMVLTAGSGGENHGVDPVDVETCLLKPSVIRCRGRYAVSLWRAAPEVVHRNGRPASRSGPSPGSGDRPAADTRSRGISKRRSFFPTSW